MRKRGGADKGAKAARGDGGATAVEPLTRDDLRSELRTFAEDTLQPALAEITEQLRWQMRMVSDGARNGPTTPSRGQEGAIKEMWSTVPARSGTVSCESDEMVLETTPSEPMRRGPYFGTFGDTGSRSQSHSWLQRRPLNAAVAESADTSRSLRRQILRQKTKPKYSEQSHWGSYSPMLSEPTSSPRSEVESEEVPERCCICQQAEVVVLHTAFEPITGIMVLLNSVVLGFETEFQATHPMGEHLPLPMQILEAIFCIVFTSELILRLLAFGPHFFIMEGWMWNVFDMFIVLIQLVDRATVMLVTFKLPVSVTLFRMLRLIRIVRITRLVKLLNLFEELRTILTSMLQSLGALGWAFLLLILVIYTFSVLFMQILIEMRKFHDDDRLQYWFGSLTRTILTMYEAILGGVSWDEVVTPLIECVGPGMGVVFCTYIALSLFAMMNLATGIFVDKAMQVAREDKDVTLASSMTTLFFGDYGNPQPITEEVFQEKLNSAVMQEFMKSLDIDSKEGVRLFSLLDFDSSGTVDPRELVSGCLRLRGPAKALDLAVITNEMSRMRSQHHAIETRLEWICEVLDRTGGSSTPAASLARRGSTMNTSELGSFNK